MNNNLILSALGHTWLFDLDGTILKHNGYKIDGYDTLLPGVKDFFKNHIRKEDKVIFLTSRKEKYKEITESFLKENNIKYDAILFDLPYGERILVNDKKPSGLEMSKAINFDRDNFSINISLNSML